MASIKENFKVIISGGSMAGLALANVLERFDIDFVVLEAHSQIAPEVGASLNLLPNGFRILDQLGIYDEWVRQNKFIPQSHHTNLHNADGTLLRHVPHMLEHVVSRHTYPIANWERREWNQLMYGCLKDKKKVLINKRVAKVDMSDTGVTVTTTDGDTFSGDILVGADGVHSVVREAMWRYAGLQPAEKNKELVAEYGCMFGISNPVDGMPLDSTNQIIKEGYTFMWSTGPKNLLYWSFHMKFPEPKYGEEIPRFTKEQTEAFVKEHSDFKLVNGVKFGTVHSSAKRATLVPLQEYVLDKWHHKRIFVTGDAAMKVNPLVGQGGNNTVETAAVLANALLRKFDEVAARSPEAKTLTTADIDAAFTEAENMRIERSKMCVKAGSDIQKMLSLATPLHRVISKVLGVPGLVPDDFIVSGVGATVLGGPVLERLPVPRRPRAIPFDDELPARPVTDSRKTWVASGMLAGALGLAVWAAGKTVVLDLSLFAVRPGGGPARTRYTGIQGVDAILAPLVSAVEWGLDSNEPGLRGLLGYFTAQMIPTFLIWTVEGYRIGHMATPLALPCLWGMASQIIGISEIAPLYYAASALFGDTSSTGRKVPDEVASAVLPATVLGYVAPYAAWLLLPRSVLSERGWQNLIAASQFAPVYVSALTMGISAAKRWLAARRHRHRTPAAGLGSGKEQEHEDGVRAVRARYSTSEAGTLKKAYAAAFVAQAVPHAIGLGRALLRCSGQSLAAAAGVLRWGGLPSSSPSPSRSLLVLESWDLVLYAGASLAYGLYTVWTLRRKGFVDDSEAKKAAVGVAAGQVLFGPGATHTGLWWWREEVLARLVRL